MNSREFQAVEVEKDARPLGLTMFLMAVFLTLSSPVTAGDFRLLKGTDVDVCVAYKKYLDSAGAPEDFVPKQKQPLICAREIPRQFTELSQPEWHEQTLSENKDIIKQILNYSEIPEDYNATAPLNPWTDSRVQDRLASSGQFLHLWLANFDIDNDGAVEAVYKYRSWSCRDKWDERRRHFTALFVFDSHGKLDREKTHLLMQNEGKWFAKNHGSLEKKIEFTYSKYAAGQMNEATFDAFSFAGVAYFDRWFDGDFNPNIERALSPRHQTLQVFSVRNKSANEICLFKYLP